MPEKRRRFDREFREGAVRIVRATNKPIAQVAADLGINPGTLGNWVNQDKINRGEGERLTSDERRCRGRAATPPPAAIAANRSPVRRRPLPVGRSRGVCLVR
jgi:transposase-like protein